MDTIDRFFVIVAILVGCVTTYLLATDYSDQKLCNHIGGMYVGGKCLKDKEEVK